MRLFVDQYVIRYGKETEIFWFGRQAELELEYGAEVEKADNMTLTEMSAFPNPLSLANAFSFWLATHPIKYAFVCFHVPFAGVQWSPYGSYLASFHPQGIALWGGAKVSRETKSGDRIDGWAKIKRFKHTAVTSIAFSPKEKFLLTSNVR